MAIRGALVGGGLISNMTGQIALILVVMIPELSIDDTLYD